MLVSFRPSSVGPQQNQNLNNSANLGWIREIEISTELGGHACHDYDVCACARKHACMLVCMHITFWRASANISAKLGQIRAIKVSMESGEHAGPVWAHNLTVTRKLVCMHAMCLCAQVQISAKLG